MILLIDNYDSFSYNLYQLIRAINPEIKVIRNDEADGRRDWALKPEAIILSPGARASAGCGLLHEVVQKLGRKIPILGVCLGHQVICEAYGGVVSKQTADARQTVRDKARYENAAVCWVCRRKRRWHGTIRWRRRRKNFPECLQVTAGTSDGEIMALQHKTKAVYGVQFHRNQF